jgi:hypothetical protein
MTDGKEHIREMYEVWPKEALSKILENIKSGFFTVKDLKLFIEMEKLPLDEKCRNICEKIRKAYMRELLSYILPDSTRVIIINFLNEKNKPYNSRQLRHEIQTFYPINSTFYESSIDFLIEDGFIIPRNSQYCNENEYELGEKGKVAAILTQKIYDEIKKYAEKLQKIC